MKINNETSPCFTEASRAIMVYLEKTTVELKYTYWKSKDGWLVGYLDIWPDHLTQGRDQAELEEMLADLYEFYKEEQGINLEKKTGMIRVPA
jgi:predicted RNase H-like HicB family nuclease